VTGICHCRPTCAPQRCPAPAGPANPNGTLCVVCQAERKRLIAERLAELDRQVKP
jgi:hypothetical protein